MRGSTRVAMAVVAGLLVCPASAARAEEPDALAKAVETWDCEGVRRALAAGASVNGVMGPDKEPALSVAARRNFRDIVELLLAHGADVNATDDFNRTPLVACLEEYMPDDEVAFAIFTALLKAGADPNRLYTELEGGRSNAPFPNRLTGTAVGLAVRRCEPKLLVALIAAGACISTPDRRIPPLAEAVDPTHREVSDPRVVQCLEILLDAGADINQRDMTSDRRTALMYAAESGSEPALRLLCRRGARVDLRDTDGETALLKAVERCSWEPIAVLLEAGADPTIPDRAGRTCLELAKGIGVEDVRQRTIAALEAAAAKRKTAPATAPASAPAPATQPAAEARDRAAMVVPVPTARP